MSQLYQEKNKYIILNPQLNQLALDSLNYGEVLDVDIEVRDKRRFSEEQRKFFYAIASEIGNERGEDQDWIKHEAKTIYQSNHGKWLSWKNESDMTMTEARELIDTLVTHALLMGYTVNGETLEEYKYNFTYQQMYIMCIKRICCVCGKRADLHHMDGSTVGMGRNRSKISHVGAEIIPLCRKHHTEFHAKGESNFKALYHIEPVTVNEELDKLIKGGKIR